MKQKERIAEYIISETDPMMWVYQFVLYTVG